MGLECTHSYRTTDLGLRLPVWTHSFAFAAGDLATTLHFYIAVSCSQVVMGGVLVILALTSMTTMLRM